MKTLFNGNKVLVHQMDGENDIFRVDFINCYEIQKSIECHGAEIVDAVENEFDEMEKDLKENMKSIKLPRPVHIDRSDLIELKKIF